MSAKLFISHAGPDALVALAIARALGEQGFAIDVDREQLRIGDRFLAFMEAALSTCDYCLLLWSKAAADAKYVQVEWEAALYKAVEEARRFLLIGRLENVPVPALLGPRLRVELFPDRAAGLAELVSLLRDDAAARDASGHRVGRAALQPTEDDAGVEVYVTSRLFGITLPLRWDLQLPCGIHVDRLVRRLGLPKQHDHEGVMGVRYAYDLVLAGQALVRELTLAEQGVQPKSMLWLEVEMQPFAAQEPIQGALGAVRLRGDEAESAALRVLLHAVDRAGLGV